MTKIDNMIAKKKSTSDLLVTQQDGEEEADEQQDRVVDTLTAEIYKTILTNPCYNFDTTQMKLMGKKMVLQIPVQLPTQGGTKSSM